VSFRGVRAYGGDRVGSTAADAGMVSEANRNAVEAAGLSFMLGAKIAQIPYVVAEWRENHKGMEIGTYLFISACAPDPEAAR